MANLFSKDEDILASPPIVGYKLLQFMEKRNLKKVSIFDIANQLKNEKWFSPKNIYFGMVFLFSVGLIDFQQPYIVKI